MGVQRVHALVHPGLRFLLLTRKGDGAIAAPWRWAASSPAWPRRASPVLAPERAGETVPQEAREALGSGIATLETRPTQAERPRRSPKKGRAARAIW